ncbi:SPOR domain-containing protein [Jannaschia sp. Os4]|uniref:SPOR domain-containing protein n=1 Tax=Jannaschia sp. Os4 TaxID=2807617 RepID=UPI00193A6CCD|nr:SPOR domain-containing protein [Jannaschia sp. Os4]MBM2577521.1 SPOR domain-containing protein [Jannaschia sp. Os4]
MRQAIRALAPSLILCGLAACNPADLVSRGDRADDGTLSAGDSVRLVERDVEAPQVFSMEDRGVWDGRPSLGGVWVAAPGVEDPERVIIRNEATGKFVIGALFKRDREVTGPPLQLSSDAAAALGLSAGAVGPVSVVALRREEVPEGTPDAKDAAALPDMDVAAIDAAVADAGADAAPLAAPEVAVAPDPVETAALEPSTAPLAPALDAPLDRGASPLDKPFVQIGYFSEEQNARNTATALRGAGIVPTVAQDTIRGRTFWRVFVGPSMSARDRAAVIRKVQALGFGDAYPVRG